MKDTNVKIISKMPDPANSSSSSENLAVTGGPCHCFVCDQEIAEQGISLLVGLTAYSKTDFPSKIGQLMGSGFMVVVSVDDVLCKRCMSLLNYMDKLEVNLEMVRNSVLAFLRVKYNLSDDDENDNDGNKNNKTEVIINKNSGKNKCLDPSEEIDLTENEQSTWVDENYEEVPYDEDDSKGLLEYESDLEADYSSDDSQTMNKVNVEIILDKRASQQLSARVNQLDDGKYSKIYKCKSCTFKTHVQATYESHILTCRFTPYKCSMCERRFESHKRIRRHIMEAHLSKWTCHFCDMNFTEEEEFTSHMKTHLGGHTVSTDKTEELIETIEDVNATKSYQCNICDFSTENKNLFDNHIRKHVVLKLFQCKSCSKRFESEEVLKDHIRKIHEPTIFICELCPNTTCESESDLLLHMKTHISNDSCVVDKEVNEINEFTLSDIDEITNIESFKKDSEKFINPEKGAPLSCNTCSESFTDESLFLEHVKLHSSKNIDIDNENTAKTNVDYDLVEAIACHNISTENIEVSGKHLNIKNVEQSPDRIDIDFSELGNILFQKIDTKSDEDNGSMKSFTQKQFQQLVCAESVDSCFFLEGPKLSEKQIFSISPTKTAESNIIVSESNSIQSENVSDNLSESLEAMVQHISIQNSNTFNSSFLDDSSDNDIICTGVSKDELIDSGIRYIFEMNNEQNLISSNANNNLTNGNSITPIKEEKTNFLKSLLSVNAKSSLPNIISKSSSKKQIHVCSKCSYRTMDITKFKEHSKSHTFNKFKIFKCYMCDERFSDNQSLFSHLRKHRNCDNEFTCPVCFIVFEDKDKMENHIDQSHQKEKIVYKCEFCGEEFLSKRSLKNHEETHLEKRYKCDECDQQFVKEKQLLDHKNTTHRDPHCRFCGKEITKARTLRNHELRHIREKDSYECDICKRVFKTKTGLRHHVAVHTGEYKYCCDYCGRGFMSRMMMEEHRSMHTKEERYICDVCGRKFSFQSTYWIHRKWHDTPYPYKCNFCGRMFRHSSLLAVHKRKHTGERPYQCPHCPLSFPVGGTLKRHLILHTGAYPFNCESCKRGFTTRHKYAMHLAKIHDDFNMLKNKNPQQNEFKMVIKNEKKKETLKASTLEDNNSDPVDLAFKIAGGVNKETLQDGMACTIVPDQLLLDNMVSTRVVEIVLNDASQTVATVALGEPGVVLPELWYQE